jgi:predicted TIM-barrel fold metal-dependent hydrolase
MNMHRRGFVQHSLLLGGAVAFPEVSAARPARQSRPRARVIDVHSHAGRGLNFDKGDPVAEPWTTFNDPRWLLQQDDEAGIDQSVIFPINNVTFEKANEEIASYVRQYPGRFIGFAKHDPKTEAGKIKDLLTREVRDLGLKGLKLHAVPSPEMLEVVAELGIPILMHPPRVRDSLEVVRTHPKINFIMAHLGSFASKDWRDHLLAIEAAKSLANLHLDTSGVTFFRYLEQAARDLPAEKLLFGSDAPLVDARIELFKIRLLKLSPANEEKGLGGNARRLLNL